MVEPQQDEQSFEELYKIVLVGDPGVGKSNMLAYFTEVDDYNEKKILDDNGVATTFSAALKPTIGVDFGTKIVQHPNGKNIKVQLWDTAGQERYRAISSSHYRRASGALLVYDVSNRETFDHACDYWIKELKEFSDKNKTLKDCIMLVGNKEDLAQAKKIPRRFVSEQEHEDAAKKLNLLHSRTSAKNGMNVKRAFEELVIRIHDEEQANTLKPGAESGETFTLSGRKEEKKSFLRGVLRCC